MCRNEEVSCRVKQSQKDRECMKSDRAELGSLRPIVFRHRLQVHARHARQLILQATYRAGLVTIICAWLLYKFDMCVDDENTMLHSTPFPGLEGSIRTGCFRPKFRTAQKAKRARSHY